MFIHCANNFVRDKLVEIADVLLLCVRSRNQSPPPKITKNVHSRTSAARLRRQTTFGSQTISATCNTYKKNMIRRRSYFFFLQIRAHFSFVCCRSPTPPPKKRDKKKNKGRLAKSTAKKILFKVKKNLLFVAFFCFVFIIFFFGRIVNIFGAASLFMTHKKKERPL